MKKLQFVWFDGVSEEEKDSRRREIQAAKPALAVLHKIMSDKLALEMKARKSDYENPSWAYLQADSIGYQRAVETLLTLITFNEDDQ